MTLERLTKNQAIKLQFGIVPEIDYSQDVPEDGYTRERVEAVAKRLGVKLDFDNRHHART